MSSRLDFRISRSLELLARLKQTVAEFAKKEDQLARDLSGRRVAAARKNRDAMDKVEARLATLTADAEARFSGQEERIQAVYEAHRDRIQRVSSVGLRNVPRLARQAKERWQGDLQMRHFRAERKQTADQEAADKALNEFAAQLAAQRAAIIRLHARARRAFFGYWTLLRLLPRERRQTPEAAADSREPDELLQQLHAHLATAEEQLREFREFPIPRVFSFLPLPVLIVLVIVTGLVVIYQLGATLVACAAAAGGAVAVIGALAFIHHLGLRDARPSATAVAEAIMEARRTLADCGAAATAKREEDRQRINAEFERTAAEVLEGWNRADQVETDFERNAREKIEKQAPRATAKNEALRQPKLERVASERVAQLAIYENEAAEKRRELTAAHEAETAALAADEKTRWAALEAEWRGAILPLFETINAMNAALSARFPAWDAQLVENWEPPADFPPATRFGQLAMDLSAYAEKAQRLALPGPAQVSIPLALTFPDEGSLLFQTNDSGGATVLGALNNIILRLLASTPPGKLSFTIIDPVGLGQSFAGLMHLSDYEESLINRRIWTQRDQIDERLAELSEHIEKVIQMYLRNEYATITEYNEQAGSVAEKYHFLVVADFPANFSETAAKRLQSIATSGPRCGVFTLLHWDQRQPLPDGFVPEEVRKGSVSVRRESGALALSKAQAESGAALVFDPPPDPDLAVALVHKIGKSSIDSNRVQVPFEQIAPAPNELWTADTTNELRIAIGRTGATKHQFLAIGKGTRQHALFAGKTGSGKSTLFHVIITNLALACSPEQVEFYLIDFKKGVEFKCYATKHLPHARVIAIESDREFALSVLQRVDAELKRRGDMFRKLGVQDVAGYKRAGGTEPMPRSLLLIDEFQEFFVEDDAIAQSASLLFDRIVRQGRAFGIHVLLGSQSLGGAYSLARATLGQMVIRVALQCNEADAYLIMDDTNSAPRLLSRPGEGIYNDAGGAMEGNSPFQVVWLPDDERDLWLDKVHDLAEHAPKRYPSPIVFEGNAPADIRDNDLFRDALDTAPAALPAAARCWLGAPNSIKGPTEAVFHRQSGNHLLIVGQRDEAALTMLGLSLLALAAQFPVGGVKFVLLQNSAPGSPDAEFFDRLLAAIPHEVTVAHGQNIGDAMNAIAAELKARTGGEHGTDAPPVFLLVHGLHRFKKLRHEDDFSFSMSDADAGPNPGAQFNDLISDGSSHGMHIVTTVDTFNNVNRFMSRKALSEFEMRVVFQMSANDSASLIDSPKASNLGLHRALFYNEHEGTLETFRPYAPPDAEWMRQAAQKLARRGA